MFERLVTTTAIVLVSAGLALAQTGGGDATTGETTGGTDAATTTGFTWDQTAQDAFFSDGQLRAEAEVRTAWDALDSSQQEQLRADCQTMAGGAATDGAATDGTAATDAATPDAASLQELCTQVESF